MARRWLLVAVLFLIVAALSGIGAALFGAALVLGFHVDLTNTLIASLLVDAVLIGLAFYAARRIRAGTADAWVPRGLQNSLEWFLEAPSEKKAPAQPESPAEGAAPAKKSRWVSMRKWVFLGVVGIVAACLLLELSSGFLATMGFPTLLDNIIGQPAMPTVSLPPEQVVGSVDILGFSTGLTNTMVAALLADVLLVGLAFLATRKIRSGSADAWVPRGLQNFIEWGIEQLYSLGELVLGSRVKQIFWLGATIFLFLLFANWMEMIPGIDAIGWIEHPQDASIATFSKSTFLGLDSIVGPTIPPTASAVAANANAAPAAAGFILVPFVRAAATDLNLTLTLALISMVTVQIFGFRSLGIRYLKKFINIDQLRKGKAMGLLDVFVGALESVSEVTKVISFTFRLFGNVFAGQVLLFIIGFFIPFVVFGSMIFYGLELFFGLIQAFVFMMLTFVFIGQATVGHGDQPEQAASH